MAFHIWESIILENKMNEVKRQCKKCKQLFQNYTEDCPERELTEEETRKLADNSIDYRDGKWRQYAKVF